MRPIAHVFVAVIFTLLGLSFLASTALVAWEFRELDWQAILIAHSHLFIFFPTLGILALCAFYLPSVIFTDHYWFHVKPIGKPRFFFGFALVLMGALYFANSLSVNPLRAVWEVSPAALRADLAKGPVQASRCFDVVRLETLAAARARGEIDRIPPPSELTRTCARLPVLTVMSDLREKAQHRLTLSVFARACRQDALLEGDPVADAGRYCFPAGQKLNAADCCRLQEAFDKNVRQLQLSTATRSLAAQYEPYLLIAKVFFILVLFVIGLFLLYWRSVLLTRYRYLLPAMERGVVIGAVAMVFWVIMDYGYQQTTDVLFGRTYQGFPQRLSLAFLPWAVVLLFYFMERLGRDLQRIAQISTIVTSAVAILSYQQLSDVTARLFGVGAAWWHFALLGGLGLIGFATLVHPLLRRSRVAPVPSGGPGSIT